MIEFNDSFIIELIMHELQTMILSSYLGGESEWGLAIVTFRELQMKGKVLQVL